MTESTTLDRVRGIFEEHYGPATLQDVGNDKPFSKAIDQHAPNDASTIDSLDRIEFLMALEEEFGIDIPDDAAVHMDTLANVAAGIDRIRAAK